ncbi:hypothetical protein scyTo_0025449 [Scyliorhinus torazame]|uniref:Uncharacterized protein n=1 Tax=Scyliorhinus torazame TaxID=75743 RepID=A0A401QHE5_SCYTO|nr:hypothetical protein [Scyliorhinus torazame]
MKGPVRAAVKDIYQDGGTATDLSQRVNQLVWKELKQLQPYQAKINELIDRQGEISQKLHRVQLTPLRDESIVDADDLERTDDAQQTDRYIQKGRPRILHLQAGWEGLKEDAKQIDHLRNKGRVLIRTLADGAEELFKSQNVSLRYGIGD